MSKFTIVVDNLTARDLALEHGFAMVVECAAGRFLFDTGAGAALLPNLAALGIPAGSLRRVIFSHGHFDHTGGLGNLAAVEPELQIYAAPGLTCRRYSRHPGQEPYELTMPVKSRQALKNPARLHEIATFREIYPQVFLTGPIPRVSGEDCGGPFFLTESGPEQDFLSDEQALLLGDGTLVQGCCHSGIINTLEYCRRCAPQIRIRTVIGGLHLLNASPERLRRTAEYLQQLDLQQLILGHCTGAAAIEYFQAHLHYPVRLARSGEIYVC